jgi:hypothetical protein
MVNHSFNQVNITRLLSSVNSVISVYKDYKPVQELHSIVTWLVLNSEIKLDFALTGNF